MKNEMAFFFNGVDPQPEQVRILLFNNAVNLYHATGNYPVRSFPLRGSSLKSTEGKLFLYPGSPETFYLEIPPENHLVRILQRDLAYSNQPALVRLLKHRALALFAAFVVAAIALYFLLITLVPVFGTRMISKETEISIGENLYQMTLAREKATGAAVDSQATARLQDFADRIKLSDAYPIRVTLVTSNVTNAYALPGGRLVIYSGMVDKIPTPEALVALLAHESAHVNERHTLRSLLRTTANSILLSIVVNDVSGVIAVLLGNAESLTKLKYSRALETEADVKGIEIMQRNNISSMGMLQLMQVLQSEEQVPASLAFLSTHPLTKERIELATRFALKHPTTMPIRRDIEIAFKNLKQHGR